MTKNLGPSYLYDFLPPPTFTVSVLSGGEDTLLTNQWVSNVMSDWRVRGSKYLNL